MSTVIKVENLSKQYRLGLVGTSTFKEDTQRWWAKLRGKEDPFLNLGTENDRTIQSDDKFVWSLKDLNFEVKEGEVLGLIGKNGAGKSTLLKILSKVTAPTTGSVKVKGRIASLLEVGTGFHPELTGRENIYLNGAILGMRKYEIKRKLDEIVSFAGVEKYLDTPVKRYSSGMYVRLAFAVAAYLESEILIVDEVLAVGDIEFQEKCLGKMEEISSGQGRTVLFVSHNMVAIRKLCTSAIELKNGHLQMIGSTDNVIENYLYSSKKNDNVGFYKFKSLLDEPFNFISASTESINGENKFLFNADENILINIIYELRSTISNMTLGVSISSIESESFWSQSDGDIFNELFLKREIGIWKSTWEIPKNILRPGVYRVTLGAAVKVGLGIEYMHHPESFSFEISIEGYWKKSAEIFGLGGGPLVKKINVTRPKLLNVY